MLSVIVSSFERYDYTKECVHRLVKLYPADTLIVIADDCSPDKDKLSSILAQFPKVMLFSNDDGPGLIACRCRAAERVLAMNVDVIQFFDNDQFVSSNTYDRMFTMLQNSDIVGCEAWTMDMRTGIPYKCMDEDLMDYVGAGGMMVRADVWKQLGGFDYQTYGYAYYEDPDFCFKAREHGYRVSWCKNAEVLHKENSTLSVHNTKLRFDLERVKEENRVKFLERWGV